MKVVIWMSTRAWLLIGTVVVAIVVVLLVLNAGGGGSGRGY